jgi:hypothetical protein
VVSGVVAMPLKWSVPEIAAREIRDRPATCRAGFKKLPKTGLNVNEWRPPTKVEEVEKWKKWKKQKTK